MQLNRGAVGGEHGGGAPDGMQLRRRERVLAAQLHELLFPSTSPSPTGGVGSWWSSSSSELCGSGEHGSSLVKAPATYARGQQLGRGSKIIRQGERRQQEQRGGCSAAIKATRCRRKKQGTTTTTFVTTVPGFDGYHWRRYGQKQIEGAQYSRSYYRCTQRTDIGCLAKRTVQRNNDVDGDSGPPKYTVVYISEHNCMATEAVSVPLNLAAQGIATVFPSSYSAFCTGTQSPASSDITIVGENPIPSEHGDSWIMLTAGDDCWELDPSPTAPTAAAALLHEMDFAGPIMSPVHVAAVDGSWINDLFVSESPFVLNSYNLFDL